MSTTPTSQTAVDPTESATYRQDFARKFGARWRAVRGAIRRRFTGGSRFRPRNARDTSRQVADFREWLTGVINEEVVEPERQVVVRQGLHWTAPHVRALYQAGLRRADRALRRAGYDVPDADHSRTLYYGEHDDRHRELLVETYQDLEDAGRETVTQSSRAYRSAVRTGAPVAVVIARLNSEENGRIRKVGEYRTGLIAEAKGVEAVNDAALERYQEFGVTEVGFEVEVAGPDEIDHGRWATAGDNRVCEQCQALEGSTYTIAAIESGDAPKPIRDTHPGCRCIITPI